VSGKPVHALATEFDAGGETLWPNVGKLAPAQRFGFGGGKAFSRGCSAVRGRNKLHQRPRTQAFMTACQQIKTERASRARVNKRGSSQSSVFVYLGLVKPRLAPARRAGFPFGGGSEQNAIHVSHRSLGTPTDIQSWIDRWVRGMMVALAAYEAAYRHWPGETITLRQGARVIEAAAKWGLA
jgi:hypothetical protein